MPREREVTGYAHLHRGPSGSDGSWGIEFNELTDDDPRVELPGPGIFPIRARLIERDGHLLLAALSIELLPSARPDLAVIDGEGP